MQDHDRLPALPLLTNDPYFSCWMPGDTLTDAETIHWTGIEKPLRGQMKIDGRYYQFLGRTHCCRMKTTAVHVTPTCTESLLEAAGVQLKITFWSPLLPDDLEILSTPISFVDFGVQSLDGRAHEVQIEFRASSEWCFDGTVPPPMTFDSFENDRLRLAYIGQKNQRILSHSGDHITMDWGYLLMGSPEGTISSNEGGLCFCWSTTCLDEQRAFVMLGYEDIASINYFGVPCRAWYARNGKGVMEQLLCFAEMHDSLLKRCRTLDENVLQKAEQIGGKDYALIVSASWRQCIAAHKLIATPKGEMALLSKENDSNGCIGTVDVSYPSIPLFLAFCPELVNALCRPVLEFASLPVWKEDFAPHDVGRYPHATGQVYACRRSCPNGEVYPPLYAYPAGSDLYELKNQMPVEECGNMLIMLEAAASFGASQRLLKQYRGLLERWVHYLERYGDDPGEQLCTDDFAGHLAHNVNLSAKAIVGIACYARILERCGEKSQAEEWEKRARSMAESWLKRAQMPSGSRLSFGQEGWSIKYNLAWDLALQLKLLPRSFYARETEGYLRHLKKYGFPLDSRAEYTKSDWEIWAASMAQDRETFCRLVAPLAKYLRETESRLPFSDWYDTETGRYVHFIARSVQGGVFMPFLTC